MGADHFCTIFDRRRTRYLFKSLLPRSIFFGSYRKQPTMKGGHHTEAGPSSLRTLIYDDAADQPTLEVLDQLLIPDKKEYIKIPNVETAWSVIRNMNIRGRYNTMTSHQGTSRERYDHLSTFSH